MGARSSTAWTGSGRCVPDAARAHGTTRSAQVVQYGVALLEQLPEASRTRVLVGITDLRSIQLLQVLRAARGEYEYELAPESPYVLPTLCAILRGAPEDVSRAGLRSVPVLRAARGAVGQWSL